MATGYCADWERKVSELQAQVGELRRKYEDTVTWGQELHRDLTAAKTLTAALQAELDKLYGPKCERSDEECPDYDTEHPYHENAMVKAHELGQEKLRGTLQDTQTALERVRQERDEAIAHDRQPYPTAWAYEQACKALENAKLLNESDELLTALVESIATEA